MFVNLPEIRMHYIEQGTGPLVVLLHGFPEFWYSWRHQIPALAAAGFRVVAVDLRGYNLSDKPRGVAAYAADRLAADVAQLITALGADKARLVGHDWGGAVAWLSAMLYPDRIHKLAILNSPHPARLLRGMLSPRQLLRSWYIFFFQLPGLPELSIRMGNWALLRRTFRRDPVRKGAFTEPDIDQYVTALSRPGALTSAIHYYRAIFRQGPRRMHAALCRIDHPVLIIWGQRDRYLGAELAQPDPHWVPNVRLERIDHASHWVQSDQPQLVNRLLLDFLL